MPWKIDRGDGRVHEVEPAVDLVIPKNRVKQRLDRCNEKLAQREITLKRALSERDAEIVTRDMYQTLYDTAAEDPT